MKAFDRRSTHSAALLAILVGLAACSDAAPSDVADAEVTRGEATAILPPFEAVVDPRVDSLLAEYDSDTAPGLAVMVIRDGEVLHANGYGVADMETGRMLTPRTPVRLASVSKQMVAFTTVLLEERGLLDYDDLVVEWVPELERFEGVTVRHLLNHTSGLPVYYDFETLQLASEAVEAPEVFTNADAVAFYETEGEFLFEPGTAYEYSNPGYEILALVTERVTGRTFTDFIETELFEPLGMRTARVRELPSTEIPDRAIGYTADSTGVWRENDDDPLNWLIGAGGIYASLEDMYRWDQALWTWADEGDRLREVFAPVEFPDGEVSNYGFGWGLAEEDPPMVGHSGAWLGFRTLILRYLDERLTVVVLSNATVGGGTIAEQVVELYRGSS